MELAGIVVACFVGIISQIKLWKVIRERRKTKLAAKADEEQQREREEEEVGRNLEEANSREMAAWEATYEHRPDKDRTDSGIGREDSAIGKEDIDRSSSASQTEDIVIEAHGEDGAEKKTANSPGERSSTWAFPNRKGSVSGNQDGGEVLSSEDGTCEVYADTRDVRGTSTPNRMSNMSTAASADFNTVPQSPGGAHPLPSPDQAEGVPSNQTPGNMSPPPSVTPLPFIVPFPNPNKGEEDELSVAASAGSDIDMNEFSRRFSRLSNFTRLSGLFGGATSPETGEECATPAANRSRPVSGAVVVDIPDSSREELTLEEDGYELRTNPNSVDDQYEIPATPQDFTSAVGQELEKNEPQETDNKSHRSSLNNRLSDESEPKEIFSDPLPSPMLTVPESGPENKAQGSADSAGKSPEETSTSPGGLGRSGSETRPTTSRTNSLTAGAVEMLPSHASSVTMSYRTNEWAKHLSRADIPSADPIQQPELQEEADDTALREEPVIPVNVVQLQQTALDARPPPVVEHHEVATATSEDSNPPGPASTVPGTSSEENPQSELPIQSPASTKNLRPSSQNMQSKGYSTPNSLNSIVDGPPAHNGYRNSSAPLLNNTVHGSVIQETSEWESSSNKEGSPSKAPPLMAVRDSMLRNRMSSSFMTRNSSAPTLLKHQQAFTDASTGANNGIPRAESVAPPDDDMPLSQRREMIRQQTLNKGESATFSYANSIHSHDYARSGARSALSQSSRQAPNSEIQREANLAAWRESLREEIAIEHAPQTTVDNRRADMLMEKRQSIRGKQQETMMAQYRDQALSQAMQRGDMQHLHREAMRKMQAQANKRA